MSAMQPLMDRIRQLGTMGGQVVDTLSSPGTALQHMFQAPSHEQQHQQAIEQMNKGLNDQHQQEVNQTFQHQPSLSTMKKPLGR